MKCQISVRVDMKKCRYPDCFNCEYEDCIMSDLDLEKMQRQKDKVEQKNVDIPNCINCANCMFVEKENGKGYYRICQSKMRLIADNVKTSPDWCEKRTLLNKCNFELKDLMRGDICPACKSEKHYVKDSRIYEGHRIRRRRCAECMFNWHTVELLYNY